MFDKNKRFIYFTIFVFCIFVEINGQIKWELPTFAPNFGDTTVITRTAPPDEFITETTPCPTDAPTTTEVNEKATTAKDDDPPTTKNQKTTKAPPSNEVTTVAEENATTPKNGGGATTAKTTSNNQKTTATTTTKKAASNPLCILDPKLCPKQDEAATTDSAATEEATTVAESENDSTTVKDSSTKSPRGQTTKGSTATTNKAASNPLCILDPKLCPKQDEAATTDSAAIEDATTSSSKSDDTSTKSSRIIYTSFGTTPCPSEAEETTTEANGNLVTKISSEITNDSDTTKNPKVTPTVESSETSVTQNDKATTKEIMQGRTTIELNIDSNDTQKTTTLNQEDPSVTTLAPSEGTSDNTNSNNPPSTPSVDSATASQAPTNSDSSDFSLPTTTVKGQRSTKIFDNLQTTITNDDDSSIPTTTAKSEFSTIKQTDDGKATVTVSSSNPTKASTDDDSDLKTTPQNSIKTTENLQNEPPLEGSTTKRVTIEDKVPTTSAASQQKTTKDSDESKTTILSDKVTNDFEVTTIEVKSTKSGNKDVTTPFSPLNQDTTTLPPNDSTNEEDSAKLTTIKFGITTTNNTTLPTNTNSTTVIPGQSNITSTLLSQQNSTHTTSMSSQMTTIKANSTQNDTTQIPSVTTLINNTTNSATTASSLPMNITASTLSNATTSTSPFTITIHNCGNASNCSSPTSTTKSPNGASKTTSPFSSTKTTSTLKSLKTTATSSNVKSTTPSSPTCQLFQIDPNTSTFDQTYSGSISSDSTVTVTCKQGYMFDDLSVIRIYKCLSNRTWVDSPETKICQKTLTKCHFPSLNLTNAISPIPSSPELTKPSEVGARITHLCKATYTFSKGQPLNIYQCQTDGTWSMTQSEYCS
uniref:Sushi domain-containing protein n=1 Tax=Panagrolaimus sp. PS1159 TaxID=55785 RepID=A0AC35FBB6_9BILA